MANVDLSGYNLNELKSMQAEIEEAIKKATSPEERTHLESNRYLLSSIIRQQKTLDFLKTLWYIPIKDYG